MWWRVVAVTYEEDDAGRLTVPVVRHELYGPSKKRALEVFEAHMKSDAFLRQCVKGSLFARRVRCRTEMRIERIGRVPA